LRQLDEHCLREDRVNVASRIRTRIGVGPLVAGKILQTIAEKRGLTARYARRRQCGGLRFAWLLLNQPARNVGLDAASDEVARVPGTGRVRRTRRLGLSRSTPKTARRTGQPRKT